MPRFSAFTPLGMLRLSGAPSHAERIYRSMVGGLSREFDTSRGSRWDAIAYAESMRLARIQYAAEAAAKQSSPGRADVMLPLHERDLGAAPPEYATAVERQEEVAARRRQMGQPTRIAVEAELRRILGDDFLALVTASVDDAAVWPAGVGDSPANLVGYGVVRRYIRLREPVAFTGIEIAVRYESAQETGVAGASEAVVVGERLVVEPDVPGLTERVTVTGASVHQQMGGGPPLRRLRAIFSRPHNVGAIATTMPFPVQRSTKRHSYVVVTPAAAVDPVRRRRINELMGRVCRASSTWDIVQGSGGTTGTFTVGSSPIGAETISPVTYP